MELELDRNRRVTERERERHGERAANAFYFIFMPSNLASHTQTAAHTHTQPARDCFALFEMWPNRTRFPSLTLVPAMRSYF